MVISTARRTAEREFVPEMCMSQGFSVSNKDNKYRNNLSLFLGNI